MKPKTKAYLVEWTDYSEPEWQYGSMLHWHIEGAAKEAEQIPFKTRIREVEISPKNLVDDKTWEEAQKQIQIWDQILLNSQK